MLQFASAAPSVEVRSGRTIIHECAFPWILILDRETGGVQCTAEVRGLLVILRRSMLKM